MGTSRRIQPPPMLSITSWERIDGLLPAQRLPVLQELTRLFANDLISGFDLTDYLMRLGVKRTPAILYVEVIAGFIDP